MGYLDRAPRMPCGLPVHHRQDELARSCRSTGAGWGFRWSARRTAYGPSSRAIAASGMPDPVPDGCGSRRPPRRSPLSGDVRRQQRARLSRQLPSVGGMSRERGPAAGRPPRAHGDVARGISSSPPSGSTGAPSSPPRGGVVEGAQHPGDGAAPRRGPAEPACISSWVWLTALRGRHRSSSPSQRAQGLARVEGRQRTVCAGVTRVACDVVVRRPAASACSCSGEGQARSWSAPVEAGRSSRRRFACTVVSGALARGSGELLGEVWRNPSLHAVAQLSELSRTRRRPLRRRAGRPRRTGCARWSAQVPPSVAVRELLQHRGVHLVVTGLRPDVNREVGDVL